LAPANATQEQIEAITLNAHKDANGELTKARAILHEQIVNQMLCGKATVPQGKRPVFVMMLGKSGSGKTTYGKEIARRIAYETNGNSYLTTNDPDESRSYLPEYNGYNAAATQAESKLITDDMLMPRALRMHQNILLDQTGSNAKKMKRYADV